MRATMQIIIRDRKGNDVDATPAAALFVKSLEAAGMAASAVAEYLMSQKWFMDWVESHPVVNEPDPDAWWLQRDS